MRPTTSVPYAVRSIVAAGSRGLPHCAVRVPAAAGVGQVQLCTRGLHQSAPQRGSSPFHLQAPQRAAGSRTRRDRCYARTRYGARECQVAWLAIILRCGFVAESGQYSVRPSDNPLQRGGATKFGCETRDQRRLKFISHYHSALDHMGRSSPGPATYGRIVRLRRTHGLLRPCSGCR